jgi:hypothetical protein
VKGTIDVSIYSDFAAPLITPFENSVAPFTNVITHHQEAQNTLKGIIDSLAGLNGTGPLSGLTGQAVGHATQQLTHMTNQRLDVLKQAIDAFQECANSSSNAAGSITSAMGSLGFGDIIEKIFQRFDIVGVIVNGRSIVDAAVSAVKEIIMEDLANPFSLLSDVASAVLDFFGGAEIQIPEYAEEIYTTAQQVMSILKLLDQMVSMLQQLSANPIQELFSTIPAFSSSVTKGGYAKLFQQSDPQKLKFGVIDVAIVGLAALALTQGNTIAKALGTSQSALGSSKSINVKPSATGSGVNKITTIAQDILSAIHGFNNSHPKAPLPTPDSAIMTATNGHYPMTITQGIFGQTSNSGNMTMSNPLGYYTQGASQTSGSSLINMLSGATPAPPMQLSDPIFGSMMGNQSSTSSSMDIMQGLSQQAQSGSFDSGFGTISI